MYAIVRIKLMVGWKEQFPFHPSNNYTNGHEEESVLHNMHLIINTHWDREYRWSFSETQFRLAEAVDDLINIMNKDPEFAYFHTDSQVSMLDDYLDIRPERTEELKK